MSWLSSADEILIVMPILVGALSRSEKWLNVVVALTTKEDVQVIYLTGQDRKEIDCPGLRYESHQINRG